MIGERRRYVRLDTAIEFIYRIKEGDASLWKKTVTRNIGPGGIRGFLDKSIQKGTLLELNIYIKNLKEPVSAIVRVVWIGKEKGNKIDAGLIFEEIDAKKKHKFLEYLCELMFPQLK